MGASETDLRVARVRVWPVDVAVTDPFVISQGQVTTARNLFVCVELHGGAVGFGEIAPFPELSGEDRDVCRAAALDLATGLVGRSAGEYRRLARELAERAPRTPAARAGLETALIDALCRAAGLPMWALWGGADVRPRETDVTIPITSLERTVELAQQWRRRGFRLLKTKVGLDPNADLQRLQAIHTAVPDAAFVVDANQGFTREQALHFAREMEKARCEVRLFEQPLAKQDLDGMAALRRELSVPIAADESVASLADATAVARHGAADFVNLKITKSGLLEATEIAAFCRAAGLRLMIGGMVETRIAMGCSFALVLGLGGIESLDLDTPLLLASDPVSGGYRYEGCRLQPWTEVGLGATVSIPSTAACVGQHLGS
jgi:L-Ala-D/L-Glu epimerase / N-acetyl-D-glutamate racemase